MTLKVWVFFLYVVFPAGADVGQQISVDQAELFSTDTECEEYREMVVELVELEAYGRKASHAFVSECTLQRVHLLRFEELDERRNGND